MNEPISHSSTTIDRSTARSNTWALRSTADRRDGPTLDAFLSQRGIDQVVRFDPCHDDRLNRELCAGRYVGVVFPDMDALWEGVWKGHAQPDRWLAAGVRIEIVDSPLDAGELRWMISQVYASHERAQRRHRRRKVAASIVMCLLALAAMAAMVWWIPLVR